MPTDRTPASPKRLRGFVVSHTRWDRAGSLPFEANRLHLVRLVDAVLDVLAREPEYRSFTLDGQTAILDDYLEIRPERRAEIAALVKAGRIFVGPCFVLPDEFLVSGESLIRNLQRGLRTVRALGGECRDAYMPDSFGHIAQMPQILRGFGLRSFLFVRGVSQELFDRAGVEFTWEAPDGSAVLALYMRGGSDNASALGHPARFGNFRGRAPEAVLAVLRLKEAIAALEPHAPSGALVLCNGGAHMPPQPELPRLLDVARAEIEGIELVHAHCSEAVDAVLGADLRREIHRGELLGNAHHPVLSSVWSSRTPLKLVNHRAESRLEKIAEPLVAALGPAAGAEHVARLDEAWRQLLLCHAQVDVCGTGVDEVHEDARYRFQQCELASESIVSEALRALALSSGMTSGPGREIVAVVNPNSEPFAGGIDVDVLWRGSIDLDSGLDFTLFDPEGRGIRVSVDVLDTEAFEARHLDHRRGVRLLVAFQARVPAHGIAFYELVAGEDPADWIDEDAGKNAIENEHYRIEARRNGSLSITHKPSGRTYDDALLFEDQPDRGDLFSFSPDPEARPASTRGISHAETDAWKGPNSQHMRIQLDWLPGYLPRELKDAGSIRLTTDVLLQDGSDRIEFRTSIDTLLPDHRLRVLLPVGRAITASNAGTSFAIERRERATAIEPEAAPERWNGYPGELVYTAQFSRDFVHAEDADGGVLVAHRGIHEYELVDGPPPKEGPRPTFCALTLMRAVGTISREGGRIRRVNAGPSLSTETSQMVSPGDLFEFAWQAVPAGIPAAELFPRAMRFAHPVHAEQVWMGEFERAAASTRPRRYGFLKVDNALVSVSAIKLAGAGRLVVRLWNRAGTTQNATIALSPELCSGRTPVRAERCDLNEDPIGACRLAGGIARLELRPHEIATLAFVFENQP
jgi:mannosylglycerate hydrolase